MLRSATPPVLGLCAWSVFTVGGVYPWGYVPLAGGASVLAGLLLLDRRIRALALRHPLSLPLVGVFACASLQLIPLPSETLASWFPATSVYLQQFSVSYAGDRVHPLSLNPDATRRALALGSVWALFLVVVSSWLSIVGARNVARGIVAIGVLVALAGVVQQRPCHGCPIYGLWKPDGLGMSFAPFVNRNHYAGWIAMALPLALGLAAGVLATSRVATARSWRDYLRFASGPAAGLSVLFIVGAVLMIVGVILSGSRSGAVCLLVALIVTIHTLAFRRRVVRASTLLGAAGAVAIAVALLVGPAAIAGGYARVSERWSDLGGRRGAWTDAVAVIKDFPLAGTGLNAYGSAMLAYQQFDTRFHYRAAHNDYLQVLADGGVLVAVPTAIAIAALGHTIRRRFREESGRAGGETYWIRVGATTGLVAIAAQEFVDFSLQIPANAFLFSILCAVATHRSPAMVGKH